MSAVGPELLERLRSFVYTEARLLDETRYAEWLDLFTADGHYWMPLTPGQTDARLQASLLYEDTLLLKIRVERLAGRRTFSQQPRSRCHHLLQQPTLESADGGVHVLRTAFHYVETRLDAQTLYAGWLRHELIIEGEALKMRLKRVDLVNSDATFGSIDLFI